jgi:hypothetical protein
VFVHMLVKSTQIHIPHQADLAFLLFCDDTVWHAPARLGLGLVVTVDARAGIKLAPSLCYSVHQVGRVKRERESP